MSLSLVIAYLFLFSLLLLCATLSFDFFFFFNDTATTEIYTVLTHSFPTRRSSDLSSVSTACRMASSMVLPRATSHPGKSGKSIRSEEHTSELQSLMRISYAVFCLKKKNKTKQYNNSMQSIIERGEKEMM